VFEISVLIRILGHKKKEETGQIKLHNEQLHTLSSLPNITRLIKLRMGWAEQQEDQKCIQELG
jgi:hypothetical protein